MSAEPKVSVVMPVRDAATWLAAAVESILGQTLKEFELIIIDDGSTDRSPEIAAALSRSEDRVRFIAEPHSLGLVRTLNKAITLSHAPLIARLDADDVALPERLALQLGCFDRKPSLVLLGSWAERMNQHGRSTGRVRPVADPQRLGAILAERNPFVHSSVMMRADAVKAVGGYRAAFLGAEDYDLWLRLAERGAIANLPQPLVRYRVHAGGVSAQFAVRQCFSARLARLAAAERRGTGFDPAARLIEPPDWWAADATAEFYAEAASICRFLDLADANVLAAHHPAEVSLPSVAAIREFSRAEKRLARRSLINLMKVKERSRALSLGRLAAALLTTLLRRAAYQAG